MTPSPVRDPELREHAARARAQRYFRELDVQLFDLESGRALGAVTHTVDVSEHGLLMDVSPPIDAGCHQRVRVELRWDGRTFASEAEIVRLDTPDALDKVAFVMGLRVDDALPAELLTTP